MTSYSERPDSGRLNSNQKSKKKLSLTPVHSPPSVLIFFQNLLAYVSSEMGGVGALAVPDPSLENKKWISLSLLRGTFVAQKSAVETPSKAYRV